MNCKFSIIAPFIYFVFSCVIYSQTKPNIRETEINTSLKNSHLTNGDLIWSDTVYITGNISIKKDSSLTIEPGTKVILTGYYKINVNGTITAKGSSSLPISFSMEDTTGFYRNDNGEGGWGGFYIFGNENSPKSEFSYCTIENCKKIFDDVSDNGGAIKVTNHQNVYINNCILRNNKAFAGGAIYCANSKISITKNEVYNNQSISGSGGAFYLENSESSIINNVIYNNAAKTRGGAIFIIYSDKNILINNTICYNTASEKGGGIMFLASAEIYNTILYYNSSREGKQGYIDNNATNDVAPSFLNCNIQEGQYGLYFEEDNFPGLYENNIETDPLFVNTDTSNFRITPESPCVDAGDHNIFDYDYDNRIQYDKDGKYRRVPGTVENERIVDIGAYEYNAPLPLHLEYEVQNVSISGKQDGSILISLSHGQEPYSIIWNTGDSTTFLSDLKSGNYSVVVTDYFGYSVSQTMLVYIDSIVSNLPTQFSIQGKVYTKDSLLQSGIVLAFKKTKNTVLLDTIARIGKGTFLLNNLDSAVYIVQAIPTPVKYNSYLPTFYSSYDNWERADTIHVYGKIYDLDVRLLQSPEFEYGERSISGNVVYEDTSSFKKSIFNTDWFEESNSTKSNMIEKAAQNIPVVLKKNNKIVLWAVSDKNGYFEFANILEGTYTIEAQKAGLNTTFLPELIINSTTPVIENVKIIIRRNDIITTYNNNYNEEFKFSVNLYPSLTDDDITVDFNYYDNLNYSMYIYDVQGRILSQGKINKPEGKSKQTFNLESLASGHYWLKVVIGEQIINKKFIKF